MCFKKIIVVLWILYMLPQHGIGQSAINLNGSDVVPKITFPGIAQADFNDAFNVLRECLVIDEPRFGFSQPFIAPGGHYGGCWWQLDASLSLHGTKWVDQRFSENMLRGFASVQKENGRIPLYGHDAVAGYPTCSSLPKLFQAADAVLRQSDDAELKSTVYDMLKAYLGWWFSDERRDAETGLVTGVFEESFPPVEKQLKAVAQVDLNVELVVACHMVAAMADDLGHVADHARYATYEKELRAAINRYMWDERSGAYYAYHVADKRRDSTLICYTFDPLRMHIAPRERIGRMVDMLTDDAYFNWSTYPVTSAAKTAPIYTETRGAYDGAPSWSGSVWTLRNMVVVQGLEDVGRFDLSAYLALKTVRMFNNNYTEFVNPTDGSGHGVQRYAWSAAQYIQMLIEKIFGIAVDMQTKTIYIRPNLDPSLAGQPLSIEGLMLPNGNRLAVHIDYRGEATRITYSVSGKPQDLEVVVGIPEKSGERVRVTDANGQRMRAQRNKRQPAVMYEVYNGTQPTGDFTFVHRGSGR